MELNFHKHVREGEVAMRSGPVLFIQHQKNAVIKHVCHKTETAILSNNSQDLGKKWWQEDQLGCFVADCLLYQWCTSELQHTWLSYLLLQFQAFLLIHSYFFLLAVKLLQFWTHQASFHQVLSSSLVIKTPGLKLDSFLILVICGFFFYGLIACAIS